MTCRIFILSLILLYTHLFAETINVSSLNKTTNILKQTSIYIDKNNQHDFSYILKNSQTLFKQNTKDYLHLGYSPDAIWLKFSIKNDTSQRVTKVLEVSNQMLDNIFLYTLQDDGSYIKQEKGVQYKKSFQDKILKHYFELSLAPKELKSYYLKTSSLSCAVFFELNIMNKDELYQKEIKHQLVLALFFGAMIALIIYNLFIFLFTKNTAYLYYILFLFFSLLNHASYTTLNLYVLPINLWILDTYFAVYYLCLMAIFALLFMRQYLNLKRFTFVDLSIKIFLTIFLFFLVFSSKEFYPIDLVTYLTLLSLIFILFIAIYLVFKKEKNALFIVAGWSIGIFGAIMLGTYNNGNWSIIYAYPYFYEFSIFSEAILFSIALAYKLNTTTKLQKALQTNKILSKELHHRVKNNMQFIISMYRLKLAKFSNREFSNALKEVEGTIQAMSSIHEMLYEQEVLQQIDMQKYLTEFIDRLQHSYDTSQIDIQLEVSTHLNMEHAIYVGIIINELLTNSFKYAFTQNKGLIEISLKKENNKFELIVADNGKGFNPQETNNTFGIELIITLVKEELHGNLNINSHQGTIYTIHWK